MFISIWCFVFLSGHTLSARETQQLQRNDRHGEYKQQIKTSVFCVVITDEGEIEVKREVTDKSISLLEGS